jgi:hypothetical protein
LLSSRLDDVSWVDAFSLPSIFDSRLSLYKEWHDFVFFDRSSQLFGLLNFAVHGNPYDSKRGYGMALAFLVVPGDKIHTAMKLIPLSRLTVSAYSPDFVGEEVAVSYLGDNSFNIKGMIDDISLDLNIPVILPPVTMNQIGFDILARNQINPGMLGAAAEMARIWDKWVELPRLSVVGRIGMQGADYFVNTNTGYQDHEGGRFDWGSVAGWDTGVLLCDPTSAGEPEKVSFLFYRYGPSGENSYGGIIVKTADGDERFFGAEKITITRSGEFSGGRAYLPGVTRLLYPDYQPKVPATIVFSASDSSDSVEITFTPRAVCTIVVASTSNDAETTFNEMYCGASFKASIGGNTYKKLIPCWFESVRPRGKLNDYASET